MFYFFSSDLSAGYQSFVSFFNLLRAVRHGVEGRVQEKMRIKYRYLEEFCKLHQRRLCAIFMSWELDGQIVYMHIPLERRNVEERTRWKRRASETLVTKFHATDPDLEGSCAKPSRINQICSRSATKGFNHRVQNALRVQNAVNWVPKFAVGAHFRGCVWLENFASVSEYAGVVWSGADFRGCSFSQIHRKQVQCSWLSAHVHANGTS